MSSNNGNILSGLPDFGSPTLQGLDVSNVQVGKRIGGVPGRQFVRFYKRVVPTCVTIEAKINEKTGSSIPVKTVVENREREFVEIVTPGEKNIVDDEVQEYHKRQFPREYIAFREGKGAPRGTPIDQLSYVPAGVVMELLIHKVQVEEQLANASDLLCGLIPDGFQLREFARASLAAREGSEVKSDVVVLKTQNDHLMKQLAAMQEQIQQLSNKSVAAVEEAKQPVSELGIQASPKPPRKTKMETV